MENESFEQALEPQPIKRKRSSILKPAEKRVSRDSRTVSFSDRCIYRELHRDGTCDITSLFLHQDMDLTMLEAVEPVAASPDQTFNSNMDISMDQASLTSSTTSQMDISLISQFASTMPKVNKIDLPNASMNESTMSIASMYESKMSMASLHETKMSIASIHESKMSIASIHEAKMSMASTHEAKMSMTSDVSSLSAATEISSYEENTITDQSADETFFGAFHDSNNISLQSRESGVDTLVHRIEALNECIQKVDQELEECRRRLDDEIEELFKFYRHIVSKDNKHEFAIQIFGLRHGLWLIIKVNPDNYPNEKLNLRFAVNKRDRHLYPFPEFAEAVRLCTKEGRHGYLTRFVINAQKFRRFLRYYGYRKPN